MRASIAVPIALLAGACTQVAPAPRDQGPRHPVIEHVSRQEILTPLPLRVRLPSSYPVEHVLALVLTWGSRAWQMVELDRDGHAWTGEVSCRQVSTVTGDTRYFFLALDEHGEIVADSGSPEWPHVATIVDVLPGGPRGLRGEPAPYRCHDPADCPPDFPGCPAYTFLRPRCASHDDCDGGFCEWDGYCTVPADYGDDNAWDEDEMLARAVRKIQTRYRSAKSGPSKAQ
jgi:hypothetical protein